MKKTFLQKITSKTFRKAAKTFIICMVILTLFLFLFIKFIYYVKENPSFMKPTIKREGIVDAENLRIKEIEKETVGNITIT